MCQFSSQTNQVLTTLCVKVPKTLKNPKIGNLARNFKHMTIVLDSNHFSTIIYTKSCRVPSFVPNKPSLNHFMRENAKNA